MKKTITFQEFLKLDIAVGKIVNASPNVKARKPSYVLTIDFGIEYGQKLSSAQLCENYNIEDLIGRQIIAVMNFEPLRVAGVKSEVLVLAVVSSQQGTVLLTPEREVNLGDNIA